MGEVGETFFCEREALNSRSEAAIVVKLETDGSVIGNVSDRLATVLVLLDCGMVTNITGKTTDPPRSAPEGVQTVGWGIELSCKYVLRVKKYHTSVRMAL